jgi:hypothetical protein
MLLSLSLTIGITNLCTRSRAKLLLFKEMCTMGSFLIFSTLALKRTRCRAIGADHPQGAAQAIGSLRLWTGHG